jgi:regulator of cell morphogenesis and NO signaling
VVEALADTDRAGESKTDSDWSRQTLSELIDHILSAHHEHLRLELPRLSEMAAKVAHAHGERFPWVLECRHVLSEFRAELESHMAKEEQVLFPMIRQIERAEPVSFAHCGGLHNPFMVMEHDHDVAGNALSRMRELSSGFTPPANACNTFRAWLQGLAELEADLHEHIHEENNILFPRAQEREAQSATT